MFTNSFQYTSNTKNGYLLNCQEARAQNIKFRIKKYSALKINLQIDLLHTTTSGWKKKKNNLDFNKDFKMTVTRVY